MTITKEQRIAELSRASDWRAALVILTSDYFANDGRVWRYVELEHRSIHFAKILKDGTFSSGEKNLLRIAASLFSTEERINLWNTFGYLDEGATELALKAIIEYCKGYK